MTTIYTIDIYANGDSRILLETISAEAATGCLLDHATPHQVDNMSTPAAGLHEGDIETDDGRLRLRLTDIHSADDDTARRAALAAHLDLDLDYIFETTIEDCYSTGARYYLVLRDAEADERCAEQIKQDLWAFRAGFLCRYMDGVTREHVATIQEQLGEDANDVVLRLVGDNLDELIRDAISADGRGHFLAQYDAEENELDEFYIYRTN